MNRTIIIVAGVMTWLSACALADGNNVTGSTSVGILSQYVFRGYQVGQDSVVIEPDITLGYEELALQLFGNIDTAEHATPYFTPDHRANASLGEADVNLSYTRAIRKLSLSGGIWYYGTRYTAQTTELYATATYDVLTKPTLSVYRDVESFPGTYINLALAHSVPVYKSMTVDIGVSAGYEAGDSKVYKTSGGKGPVYSAFHDGMAKIGLTVPVWTNAVVQPTVQYWFPLSDKAGRTGYNPFGQLQTDFVYGISATLSF